MTEPRYQPIESAWREFVRDLVNSPSLCMVCQEASTEALVERVRRRDWEQIITELEQHFTLGAIARLLHRSKPALLHWKSGGEPKESDARRMLALHAKYCARRAA